MSIGSILSRVLWGRRRQVIVIDRAAPETVEVVPAPAVPEVVIVQERPVIPRTIIIKRPAPRKVIVKETIIRKRR